MNLDLDMLGLAKATQIAAVASAIALATPRRAAHVPAAIALFLLAGLSLGRGPLQAALKVSTQPILVYADGAAELGLIATVAGLALAVAVRAEHRRRAVAGAVVVWALASLALGAAYPSPLVVGEGLHRVYFAADLFGLFVSACALVVWAQRTVADRRSPDGVSLVALALVALDAAILLAPFSPWRGALYGSDFSGVQLLITAFFAIFAVAQVVAWRSSRG